MNKIQKIIAENKVKEYLTRKAAYDFSNEVYKIIGEVPPRDFEYSFDLWTLKIKHVCLVDMGWNNLVFVEKVKVPNIVKSLFQSFETETYDFGTCEHQVIPNKKHQESFLTALKNHLGNGTT